MGRHAFFNTGFEYKFVFAVQNSGDILAYGGWFNNSIDDPIVKWIATESSDAILTTLRQMEHDAGWSAMEFADYPTNIDGTVRLRKVLGWKEHDSYALYRLGCFIYHQLLYQPELSCMVEF